MSDNTHIEWTDATWNIITGCSVVSAGCTNCYAMKLAGTRLKHTPSRQGLTDMTKAGPVWNGAVRFNGHMLAQPLTWKRPRRIFPCAHGDLFHEMVPDEWIDQVFAIMALTPHHTYQVLTKRPERMRAYLSDKAVVRRICETAHKIHSDRKCFDGGPEFSRGNSRRFNAKMKDWWKHVGALTAWTVKGGCAADMFERAEPGAAYPSRLAWPLPNVWLGVSIEDQKTADARVPDLLNTPTAIRFVSAEPLLGNINLQALAMPVDWPRCECADDSPTINALTASVFCPGCCEGAESIDCGRLDWVIVGGENGPRPMHPDWARSLRDQCTDNDTAFFFKQWGSWAPVLDRQREDPDWRKDYSNEFGESKNQKWLNLAGGSGFHGECFHVMRKVGKKAAGNELDGQVHQNWPEAALP